MRYFMLKQDERITDMPYQQDLFEKIDLRHISASKAGLIPARTLIRLRPSKNTVFPDVLCNPVLLVTREMRDVIKVFDQYLVFRQVVCLDPENQMVQLYFMPMLEDIDCLSDKSEYVNESRATLSKAVIMRSPIRDKSLFQIKHNTKRISIIRLDLAESLLTRGCKGFTLVEAAVE